jgi:hypothetical protein
VTLPVQSDAEGPRPLTEAELEHLRELMTHRPDGDRLGFALYPHRCPTCLSIADALAARNVLEERYGHLRPADAPIACACPRSPAHRETDWRRPGGPLVCGVCHPPALEEWGA